MTLISVLSGLCQPKRLYENVRGHAPCISADLDEGETPLSLGILKSFSSRGVQSGGTSRSCATNNTVSNSAKEHKYETFYFGVEFGAQTTAKDSGSMRWKALCVCRSTEDMKPWSQMRNIGQATRSCGVKHSQDCVGCVCIWIVTV